MTTARQYYINLVNRADMNRTKLAPDSICGVYGYLQIRLTYPVGCIPGTGWSVFLREFGFAGYTR